MTQYIGKNKIKEEIEKRFDKYSSSILKHYDACTEARASELGKILTILDTLEVKEVREETVNEDLEEAAEEYAPDFSNSIASKAAVDAIRDAFKAGTQWQALHSLETIKGMEEQAFLSGVEAEQINKSFSKEELLNRWRNKL